MNDSLKTSMQLDESLINLTYSLKFLIQALTVADKVGHRLFGLDIKTAAQ